MVHKHEKSAAAIAQEEAHTSEMHKLKQQMVDAKAVKAAAKNHSLKLSIKGLRRARHEVEAAARIHEAEAEACYELRREFKEERRAHERASAATASASKKRDSESSMTSASAIHVLSQQQTWSNRISSPVVATAAYGAPKRNLRLKHPNDEGQ